MTHISQKWLAVLVPFTENYAQKLTGSAIARKVRMPQKTVSRALDALSPRVVRYVRDGRNKYYYFNLSDKTALVALTAVEHMKSLTFLSRFNELRVLIAETLEYAPIVLFGSYAKGTVQDDSDVDVWVVGRKNKKIEDIAQRFPKKIHLQYSTLDEFKRKLEKNPLAREIAKHHVIFGSGVIEILFDYWRKHA